MSLEEVIQRLEEEEYQFFQMPGSADPVEKEGELEKEGESGKGDATSDEGVGTPMVHCTFPFVNTLSIMIAVRRVYPALQKYISVSIALVRCCHVDNQKAISPVSFPQRLKS